MFFHKTHTKKDIIKIFKSLDIYIDLRLTKKEIMDNFDLYSLNCTYNENIKNLTELIAYFNRPSNSQKINIEEKKILMLKCRRLIQYATCHYNLDDSIYMNHQDPYKECLEIHKYGDIPSVRRACRLYNASPYRINHVNPQISTEIQQELNETKIIKKQYLTSLKIRRGKILVYFD